MRGPRVGEEASSALRRGAARARSSMIAASEDRRERGRHEE
jgi:hypothetical protein